MSDITSHTGQDVNVSVLALIVWMVGAVRSDVDVRSTALNLLEETFHPVTDKIITQIITITKLLYFTMHTNHHRQLWANTDTSIKWTEEKQCKRTSDKKDWNNGSCVLPRKTLSRSNKEGVRMQKSTMKVRDKQRGASAGTCVFMLQTGLDSVDVHADVCAPPFTCCPVALTIMNLWHQCTIWIVYLQMSKNWGRLSTSNSLENVWFVWRSATCFTNSFTGRASLSSAEKKDLES